MQQIHHALMILFPDGIISTAEIGSGNCRRIGGRISGRSGKNGNCQQTIERR